MENLEYITHAQNNQHAYDMKLRNAQGIKNGRAKLTEEDIINIRRLHKEGKHYKDIAGMYNISFQHTNAIIRKVFWPHI